MKYDVICIGSAVLDTFIDTRTSFKKIQLGDKVQVQSAQNHPGGSAVNSAVALRKQGLKVGFVSKLGQDHDAQFIHAFLQQNKITYLCRNNSHHHTDTSVIIDYLPDQDRIIYNHKSASLDLNPSDIPALDCTWIYLGTLMGKSLQTAHHIARYVQKHNLRLLFNPSLYLAQKGRKFLQPILSSTEILVLNLEEAQALANSKNSQEQLLSILRSYGPKTIIITNGKEKLMASYKNSTYQIQPPKVKIVHTAGAGDAFTAAFLGALIKNHPFETCLLIGQANATSVIQDRGVHHLLRSEAQALKDIKRYQIKLIKHNEIIKHDVKIKHGRK